MPTGKIKNSTEQYCLDRLKEEGLLEGYENQTFELVPAFQKEGLFARTLNGKGDFIDRSGKVQPIKYTPDFVGKDFIIEVKGYVKAGSYDAYPLRRKLFFMWQHIFDDKRPFYEPRNKKEIDKTIELIKSKRNA